MANNPKYLKKYHDFCKTDRTLGLRLSNAEYLKLEKYANEHNMTKQMVIRKLLKNIL